MAAKIAEGGKTVMAGQNVRLLDIIADGRRFGAFDELHDAADGESFSKHMKNATAKSYGIAGPRFVRVLLRCNRANLIKICRTIWRVWGSMAMEMLTQSEQLIVHGLMKLHTPSDDVTSIYCI